MERFLLEKEILKFHLDLLSLIFRFLYVQLV